MEGQEDQRAARRLAALIDHERDEIERRWLARVREDVAGAPGIELTHLRDGMPEYLAGLAALLVAPRATFERDAREVWAKVAREHGVTRMRIGFDIGQLVHEFVVLRQVIRAVAVDAGVAIDGPESILADILDAAIAAAVQAYVEARDHETKRRQAEYVAFLTHELRNPLGTAMLTASLLRRHVPQETRTLEKLERSHQRLSEMIDGVLLTEKLGAGTVESRPTNVDLGQILDDAVEVARSAAERKGLAFRIASVAGLCVHVDPLLTRTAIQHLAENAVRYAEKRGIDVAVEPRLDDVVIHVRNDCPALTAEEVRTLFEPFERTPTPEAGAGLGLVVARRAIEAQGGSIQAAQAGSSGCHFWITLPRHVVAPHPH